MHPRSTVGVCRLMFFFSLMLAATLTGAQTADGDFSIVVLPDTQNYSQYYPQIFAAQTQWIAAQRDALHIQLVIGVGDIVNDGSSDAQWQNADAAMRTLDQAGVPYVMAIGNHDYDGQRPQDRAATKFNQYFGPQRYASYPWYHGENNYPAGSNESFFATFTIGGKDYLILTMEFVPRDAALDWARQVIAANADKEIILVTHSNMYGDNTRVDQCDTNDVNRDNDGEETWTKFASQYPNISMVLSGHITKPPTGVRTDVGVNGNLVNQLLSDFQDGKTGGNGYLRVMTFHPALNSIDVQTYSPWVDAFLTDAANQFTWKWHADGNESGSPLVNGFVKAARAGYSSDCGRLADASISVSEGTLTNDGTGNFTLTLEPDEEEPATITVSRPGYYTATRTVVAHKGYPAEEDFFLQAIVGSVAGHVQDAATGAAIAGATVSMTGDGLPFTKTVTTSATGDYSSASIPVGNYQLTITATGYNAATATAAVTENTKTVTNVFMTSSGPPPPAPSSCSATTNGVNICTPGSGSTVASPFTVTAAAKSGAAIKFSQVYLDGVLQTTVNGGNVNVPLSTADGSHRVTVQAKDVNGVLLKATSFITVSSSPPPSGGCTPAAAGVTICSPSVGANSSSPVTVSAAAQSSAPIKFMQIYLDGVVNQTVNGSSVLVQVAMSAGTHRVTVQAKDANGVMVKSSVSCTVQ
jgi:hypothetical protein